MEKRRSYIAPEWSMRTLEALAFVIPFYKRLSTIMIILQLGLTGATDLPKQRPWLTTRMWPMYLLFVQFALLLIGMTYSEHVDAGWKEIGIKLSLLAFPVLAIIMRPLSSSVVERLERSFLWGCLSFIVLAMIVGTYRTYTTGDPGFLSYERLGIYLHPTYAAIYQCLGVFMLLESGAAKRYFFGKAIWHFLVIAIILIFIAMLASKAGYIGAAMSIAAGCTVYWQKGRWLKGTLVGGAAMVVFVGTMLLLPASSARMQVAVQDVQSQVATENVSPALADTASAHEARSSTALRMVTWSASFDLFAHQPFGAGTGDVTPELEEKYLSMHETYAAERSLNSHNQFLQIGAEMGWPGLIVFFAMLVSAVVIFFKDNNLLALHFMSLCIMNFLFESCLEVQGGLVFFCFWMMVFLKKDSASNS